MTIQELHAKLSVYVQEILEPVAKFRIDEFDSEGPMYSFHDTCRAFQLCPYCVGNAVQEILREAKITTGRGDLTLIPVIGRHELFVLYMNFESPVTREIQGMVASLNTMVQEEDDGDNTILRGLSS